MNTTDILTTDCQIPKCFDLYNKMHMFGNVEEAKFLYAISAIGMLSNGEAGFASECSACGSCLEKCPQNINIPDFLQKVSAELEGPNLEERLAVARKMFKTELK